MVKHGGGFLWATAGLATAVIVGRTLPITICNKGNKDLKVGKYSNKTGADAPGERHSVHLLLY